MNWLLFHSLIFGACIVVLIASAPASDNMKEIKRDVKSSEMDEILADDIKHKRSQEVIMFGNQQNKPAGMVDDALIGFVDKKSDKNQEDDEEDDNDDSSDEKTPYNSTDKKNSKVPVVAEVGTDEQESAEEPFIENDDVSSPDNEQFENEPYLQRNFHNGYQYDEADDATNMQRLEDKNINNINDIAEDWLERKRRNIKRSARHFQKRSLLTPLDKLMNLRHGARWKRDSKFREDDVVGLLGLLAAAEAAKERQELQRHHNLEELEAAYKESLGHPEYSRFGEPRNIDLGGDNYGYYPVRYDESDEEGEEETPDVVVLDREIPMKRRSYPFYPPVDYRSLGIIGNKKRNMETPRRPSFWGRIEQRKHSLFNEPDVAELAEILQNQQDAREDFSEEDEDEDRDNGSDEDKLYNLGELLNGIDVENARYPYSRQFN